MRFVVDASVLVLAACDPRGDPRAELVQILWPEAADRGELTAPAILAWEVANVVHHKRPNLFGPDVEARLALVQALLASVRLTSWSDEDVQGIAHATEEHGLTAYDAAYLALATRGDDAHLVTEDRRLLSAARAVLWERAVDLQGLYEVMEAGRV